MAAMVWFNALQSYHVSNGNHCRPQVDNHDDTAEFESLLAVVARVLDMEVRRNLGNAVHTTPVVFSEGRMVAQQVHPRQPVGGGGVQQQVVSPAAVPGVRQVGR